MELCFYRKKKKKETLVLKVILPYDFSSRYQSSGPLDMSDANASILPIKGKINFRQIIPKKKKKELTEISVTGSLFIRTNILMFWDKSMSQ